MQLDSRPHGMTWDLIHHGMEVSICNLQGSPKFDADGCVVNPLDNTCYDIRYRGLQYDDCTSTISIENSENEIHIFRSL